ncbi:hypothetical protein L2E82_10189 [Cichorium intybus]|uniref:Uncharacterized protein n=1 Tax=Cichorium intybus TaxID=13427 RepID=A0ACB9G9S1_CICIN|nr:hypothetical protein L2E82_10189 [Cichorium intybus]
MKKMKGSVGESFVKDSSPDEHASDKMITSADNFEELQNEAENGEKKCLEKGLENNGGEVLEVNGSKGVAINTIGSSSPNRETQNEEAQLKNNSCSLEEVKVIGPISETCVDPILKNEEDLPEMLNGVSDRLKELLSKSTPIKEKIKNAGVEIKNLLVDTKRRKEGQYWKNMLARRKTKIRYRVQKGKKKRISFSGRKE